MCAAHIRGLVARAWDPCMNGTFPKNIVGDSIHLNHVDGSGLVSQGHLDSAKEGPDWLHANRHGGFVSFCENV